MKKLLVVMMIFLVSLSFAGDFGLFKAAPTAGLIFPENDWEMGFQVGAKAYVGSLMDGKIGLFPVVSYWASKYDFDNAFIDDDLELKMSNIKLGIDGHYDLGEFVDGLYAGAGLSLNILTIEFPSFDYNYVAGTTKTGTDSDSDTNLGITLLAGYNFNNFFVEGSFDLIDNLNTFGIKGGMWFDLKK